MTANTTEHSGWLERVFGLTARGTSVGQEARGALTTWMAIAYILAVHPAMLSDAIVIEGVDVRAQLVTTTALSAAVGCLIMGLWARLPVALAPGMGLNAYFAYTVVLGMGVPWQTALGAVFLSGVCFVVLSLAGAREAIVDALPGPLRIATAGGIGLFLAFLGFQAAGITVDHPATLVALGPLDAGGPMVAAVGLVAAVVLTARNVPGAFLIAMVLATGAAIASGAAVFGGEPFAGLEDGLVAWPVWPTDVAGALDIPAAMGLGVLDVVFVFLFVDFFDTAGTLLGLAERGGLLRDGRLPRATQAFASDAVGTMIGACLGTSTTTSYIESAAGIFDGARTGLSAVFVGLLFLASTCLWPVALLVPGAATAAVLWMVGAQMLGGVRELPWSDPVRAVPCFLTLLLMPLTFSIAHGIAAGLVTWSVFHALAGRRDEVSPMLWGLTVLVVARYAWLAGG